ncbi:hypothetical protein ASC95_15525 [Pelomonas sp. Root1217]|nr:hypothetical protein ASC95_15525 [Pelomonas sp. Root1217]
MATSDAYGCAALSDDPRCPAGTGHRGIASAGSHVRKFAWLIDALLIQRKDRDGARDYLQQRCRRWRLIWSAERRMTEPFSMP